MLGVYDIRVSEFQFHHYITKNALRGGHDEQVKPTLISLIREYFEDPEERVLAYVCDSSDGRAAERARLFSQWHEELADIADGHEIEVAIGDEKIYGGLFIPKKRQYGKVIQEYLIDEAGQIIVQKFGL